MTNRARVVVLFLLAAFCAFQSLAGQTATAPQPPPALPTPTPWYEPEIATFEAADKKSPPAPNSVLFIGSSSIRMWSTLVGDMAPIPVLNRGFGGSKTPEVLAVFDRIVLPYKPSIIVYYCGDNDLGTDNTNAQAAADGFITFDKRARELWPKVQTFYIAIKPSLARWSNWPAMQKANELVRTYCEQTPGAAFLDIATPTLTDNGKPDPTIFEKDGLHLNAKGYAVWKRVIGPPVQKAWNEKKN